MKTTTACNRYAEFGFKILRACKKLMFGDPRRDTQAAHRGRQNLPPHLARHGIRVGSAHGSGMVGSLPEKCPRPHDSARRRRLVCFQAAPAQDWCPRRLEGPPTTASTSRKTARPPPSSTRRPGGPRKQISGPPGNQCSAHPRSLHAPTPVQQGSIPGHQLASGANARPSSISRDTPILMNASDERQNLDTLLLQNCIPDIMFP